ncbi:TPA: hypothetical protein DD449_04050 [Candidatus Berkelbacteria bacterium]|uniref:TrbC/VIRB2 family protein n=1 Tax=Berkelbacteria bacterium GW2011_GWE1_39_12 TaxID=1618337 RepID=A0A0G4B4C0_9BACT|nr:MAG: hypothetical protein UT28_C0001G0432 [Berkelbacteria bacterium GW2011_GWE1_39_12]HBO60830.1 hypothetical protein [Candidatus Berkelbacteria bacterium]
MINLLKDLPIISRAYAQPTAVVTDIGHAVNFGDYINNVINVITPILGSIALLVFIIAGYLYITSQGDQSKIGLAKELIIGVITGILLLFLINVLKTQIGF